MRIYDNVETVVIVPVLVGSLCNKCGNVFEPNDTNIQPLNTPLVGYGNLKYEICNDCQLKFIKSFTIVPTNFKSSPHFTSSFDLDHDLHQSLFEEWKKTDVWNCDENPWKSYYSEDILDQENESYEEYEEYYEDISNAIEVRKPLHINIVRLATVHQIGLAKRWCENND